MIIVHTQCVTRKQKNPAKSIELAKRAPNRPSGIPLKDLMPKKRVTGGKGLLFGTSDSSQPQTQQPEKKP
jgi:pyruvate/2-oxoacid:ferredoxin oxidoreductase beta subunit